MPTLQPTHARQFAVQHILHASTTLWQRVCMSVCVQHMDASYGTNRNWFETDHSLGTSMTHALFTCFGVLTGFLLTFSGREGLTWSIFISVQMGPLYSHAAMPKFPVVTSFAACLHCSSTQAHHGLHCCECRNGTHCVHSCSQLKHTHHHLVHAWHLQPMAHDTKSYLMLHIHPCPKQRITNP